MTLTATRAPARTAALRAAADDGFDPDGGPWTFSGIAVGAGDILHKPDGEPILFRASELEAAAKSQEGEPITADHPTEDGKPKYPPETDETSGKVVRADYIEGKGVGYEATITDADLAEGIHAGIYEVSVHAEFDEGPTDPETGITVAENIEFRDLSVVSRGDSPSNSAEWGPSQELAAWASDHDVSEVLASMDDRDEVPETDLRDEGHAGGPVERLAAALRDVVAAGDADDGPTGDEPAESGADTETSDMGDTDDETSETDDEQQQTEPTTPDGEVDPLAEKLNETGHDSLDDLIDARVEERLAEADTDADEDDDLSIEERVDQLVDERVNQAVEAKRERDRKAERVDEIIAHDEGFDTEDREELLETSDEVLARLHEQATATASAPDLPGATGGRAAMTASRNTDGDADDFADSLSAVRGTEGDD